MSKLTNDRLNPIWHRMLYSCIRMATVGVKESESVVTNETELYLRQRTWDGHVRSAAGAVQMIVSV